MLKNDTLKNGTSRTGLYGSAPPGCIRTAWKRMGNMFATVLTTIKTIWRPDLKYKNLTSIFLLEKVCTLSI